MTDTTPLQAARPLLKAANFYPCALQVIPAHYAQPFRGEVLEGGRRAFELRRLKYGF